MQREAETQIPSEKIEFIDKNNKKSLLSLEELSIKIKEKTGRNFQWSDVFTVSIKGDEEKVLDSPVKCLNLSYFTIYESKDEQLGFGVRARRLIPRQTKIGCYTGKIESRAANSSNHVYKYGIYKIRKPKSHYDLDCVVNAEKMGNITCFIQHAPNPWLGYTDPKYINNNLDVDIELINDHIVVSLRTLRDIEIDEELAFNYSRSYWRQLSQMPHHITKDGRLGEIISNSTVNEHIRLLPQLIDLKLATRIYQKEGDFKELAVLICSAHKDILRYLNGRERKILKNKQFRKSLKVLKELKEAIVPELIPKDRAIFYLDEKMSATRSPSMERLLALVDLENIRVCLTESVKISLVDIARLEQEKSILQNHKNTERIDDQLMILYLRYIHYLDMTHSAMHKRLARGHLNDYKKKLDYLVATRGIYQLRSLYDDHTEVDGRSTQLIDDREKETEFSSEDDSTLAPEVSPKLLSMLFPTQQKNTKKTSGKAAGTHSFSKNH